MFKYLEKWGRDECRKVFRFRHWSDRKDASGDLDFELIEHTAMYQVRFGSVRTSLFARR